MRNHRNHIARPPQRKPVANVGFAVEGPDFSSLSWPRNHPVVEVMQNIRVE